MTPKELIDFRDRLQYLYDYDPSTGIVRNRETNKASGYEHDNGYLRLCISGRQYYLHRLVWIMMRGEEPETIDHINRVVDDNRWVNLRNVSLAENNRNQGLRKTNKTGYTGVEVDKLGRYRANLTHKGRRYKKGWTYDLDVAVAQRLDLEELSGRRDPSLINEG